MRREFFILANVNETQQRYAKWNERTPEGKRRKQMAQVNLEIVLARKRTFSSGSAAKEHEKSTKTLYGTPSDAYNCCMTNGTRFRPST